MDKLPKLLNQVSNKLKSGTREPIYSIGDLASLTGLTSKQVRYRLDKLGVKPVAQTAGLTAGFKPKLLYRAEALQLLRSLQPITGN